MPLHSTELCHVTRCWVITNSFFDETGCWIINQLSLLIQFPIQFILPRTYPNINSQTFKYFIRTSTIRAPKMSLMWQWFKGTCLGTCLFFSSVHLSYLLHVSKFTLHIRYNITFLGRKRCWFITFDKTHNCPAKWWNRILTESVLFRNICKCYIITNQCLMFTMPLQVYSRYHWHVLAEFLIWLELCPVVGKTSSNT